MYHLPAVHVEAVNLATDLNLVAVRLRHDSLATLSMNDECVIV